MAKPVDVMSTEIEEPGMRDFIMLMHGDTVDALSPDMWPPYLATLRALRIFDGGSSIGTGDTFRKQGVPGVMSPHLGGYIRVRAKDLASARALLSGNPVFECGGTVEIRELPRD
jgi:hypothetical protein